MSEPWYNQPRIRYHRREAVVIGGGLAGTSVAFSLAKTGWKIKLIERQQKLANEASGNGVAIISSLISHKNDVIGEFFLQGFLYTLKHLGELTKQGANIKMDICGVLELSSANLNKNIADLSITSDLIEKITQSTASKIFGISLKSDALYIKNGGWISPVDLCNANIEAYKNNIEIIYNSEAINLHQQDNQWIVKSGVGDIIAKSEVVVIANANDANKFIQTSWLPLISVRGQVTHLENADIKINNVICYEGGYITPQINGINYVGATFARDNLNTNVLDEDNNMNICNLREIMPVNFNSQKTLQGRAALRSTSPDRRPMLGAVADKESFFKDYADLRHGKTNAKYVDGKYHAGLYVATGFGSRGVTGCPIAGEVLAEMINNETLPLNKKIIDAINPARFLIRDLKRQAQFSS
jgi:tRNA 5-methylaminomethyl-2-thiouridine biosynthesis bifunctional protein